MDDIDFFALSPREQWAQIATDEGLSVDFNSFDSTNPDLCARHVLNARTPGFGDVLFESCPAPAKLANLLRRITPKGERTPHVITEDGVLELSRRAQALSLAIHDKYYELQDIVVRHEDTIQKRWTKKSKQKRKALLVESWPGMPAHHRPDIIALNKEPVPQRLQATKYLDHYMWPSLNIEDLSKPNNILLLINSRARHHPTNFTAHGMILNGVTNPQNYGKIVAFKDHSEARSWVGPGKQFDATGGMLVLEIQNHVLRFLVCFCKAILRDISPECLACATYPIRLEPGLKTVMETKGVELLATMAEEAPYRLPARLDFARMELLLQAKLSAAQDHMWALREDPAYFVSKMVELQELFKADKGKTVSLPPQCRDDNFVAISIRTLVQRAYYEIEIYAELHRQAKSLRLVHAEYATQLSPDVDPRPNFLDDLFSFYHFLAKTVEGTSRGTLSKDFQLSQFGPLL